MEDSEMDSPNCKGWFRYSFICQGTLTKRQQRDLFGLRVKLEIDSDGQSQPFGLEIDSKKVKTYQYSIRKSRK